MSTILKALKKLEQDKQAYQIGGMPAGYMGPGSTQVQSSRRFRPLRAMLVVLIIFTLGGAGYFYLMSRNTATQTPNPIMAQNKPHDSTGVPSKTQAPEAPESQDLTPSPVAAPAEKPAVLISEAPSKRPSASRTPPVKSNADKLSGQDASIANPGFKPSAEHASSQRLSAEALFQPKKTIPAQPKPDESALTPAIATQQRHDKALVADKPVRQTKPVAAPKPVEAPKSEEVAKPEEAIKPDAKPDDAYDGVTPLNDGRLKVQAIAWSSVAEDRMAVINTRILHEGDKVDGFLVVSIRHDDVVVREKGVVYRVIFGRP